MFLHLKPVESCRWKKQRGFIERMLHWRSIGEKNTNGLKKENRTRRIGK
jgi:hypothetical protein